MSETPKKYNIDNAKNDIQNLQDQNKYDFQEIKRLERLIKEYDERVLQVINFNSQLNKKIKSEILSLLDKIKNLEDNSPSGGGSGLTTTQTNQLNAAYNHSQTLHVKTSDIPTKTSQLINNSGYITTIPAEYITETELITKSYATKKFVSDKIAEASLSSGNVDLSGYATKDELNAKANISAIPTKTSQLINNSGYITTIPAEYITETKLNAKGYLTSHQDISNLQNKTDNGLITTNKTIIGAINELFTLIKNIQDGSSGLGNEYETSCTSAYILDKMYPMGQPHEAIPSGLITDTWKNNT